MWQTDGQTDILRRRSPLCIASRGNDAFLWPTMRIALCFMPRDDRGLCRHAVSVCLSICLSVRVSVTFVHSVKTNKLMFKFFSPPDSRIILVFLYQTAQQYSDGNPSNGAVECRWGRQKSRFCFYSEPISGFNARTVDATGQVLSIRRRRTTVP